MTKKLTVKNIDDGVDLDVLFSKRNRWDEISFAGLKRGERLGDRSLEEACLLVRHACQSNATFLDLSDQGLENFKVEELLTLFSPLVDSSVRGIDLSKNTFFRAGSVEFPLASLVEALSNQNVQHFNLNEVGLGYLSNEQLLEFARTITRLQINTLLLKGNDLGEHSPHWLDVIARSSYLEQLSLARNNFTTQDLISPFIGSSLQDLDLSLNPSLGIGEDGIDRLASRLSHLKETNIRDLSLRGCQLGERTEVLAEIFNRLAESKLRALNIGDAMFENLSPEELYQLFASLAESSITHLYATYLFEEEYPSVEQLTKLQEGLLSISALSHMDLSENKLDAFLGNEGALVDWVGVFQTKLRSLNLSDCSLSELSLGEAAINSLANGKGVIELNGLSEAELQEKIKAGRTILSRARPRLGAMAVPRSSFSQHPLMPLDEENEEKEQAVKAKESFLSHQQRASSQEVSLLARKEGFSDSETDGNESSPASNTQAAGQESWGSFWRRAFAPSFREQDFSQEEREEMAMRAVLNGGELIF